MYSDILPSSRRALQVVLVAGWLSAVGSGISGSLNPTNTTLTVMGPVASGITCGVLAFAAAFACAGVLSRIYQIEWIAAWVAAAGFVPYLIVIWSLSITENLSWLTAAFISTVSMTFYVFRAVTCAVHAMRLRTLHEAGQHVTEVLRSADSGL